MRDDEPTKKRFNWIMNAFAEVFGQATNPQKNRIYFDYLKMYAIETLEDAARHLIEHKKISTFPTIAEWISYTRLSDESKHFLGSKAWDEVQRALVAIERPQDQIAMEAICIIYGSWDNYRMSESSPDQMPFERKEFLKVYATLLDEKRDKLLKQSDTRGALERATGKDSGRTYELDFKKKQGGDD